MAKFDAQQARPLTITTYVPLSIETLQVRLSFFVLGIFNVASLSLLLQASKLVRQLIARRFGCRTVLLQKIRVLPDRDLFPSWLNLQVQRDSCGRRGRQGYRHDADGRFEEATLRPDSPSTTQSSTRTAQLARANRWLFVFVSLCPPPPFNS